MISPDKLSRDYYITTIAIDVISMHNILVKVLSSDQLSRVFEQIIREMQAKLLDLYSCIDIRTAVSA